MTLYYIYCIWAKTEQGVLRYYGYTENMRVRKNKHKSNHKLWVDAGRPEKVSDVSGVSRSVFVLEHEDWRMDKVDEIECDDKKDAEKLEGEWILKNDCVNMHVSGRTPTEFRRVYRKKHPEKMKQISDKYYEKNKPEILAKRKEEVKCDVCGKVVQKYNVARHNRSKKHLNCITV